MPDPAHPAPVSGPRPRRNDRSEPLGGFHCTVHPGCDQTAETQWSHPVTADNAEHLTTLFGLRTPLIPGDTVPVFACRTHAPAGTAYEDDEPSPVPG